MESASSTLMERRKLNEEIERSFILTAVSVRNILLFYQTERGVSLLDLYESFYSSFTLLVMLTSDLPQMKQSNAAITNALKWIDQKTKMEKDEYVLSRCKGGITVFNEYKKVLSDQGVISLPSR